MSALSDYNPLKSLTIAGVEVISPKGIILIVGPNSSGKTLLLKDIENHLTTGIPGGVVC